MSPRPQSRPQRKGTRTSYLTTATGWVTASREEREREALLAWSSDSRLERLAESVIVTARMEGVERPLTLPQLAITDPMDLYETRRPASWTERVNRTTLVLIKSQAPYHVWAESLNERFHIWDLLVGRPQARVVTQVLCLTWRDEQIALKHYPDLLWWEEDDKLLADVTSEGRRRATQTLAWELTARLCERLGWGYELRLPMTSQRVANLGAVDLATDVDRATVELAAKVDAGLDAEGSSLYRLIRTFGGTGCSPLLAALHLVANGRLHLDLDDPIRSSTWLHRQPAATSVPAPVADRSRWLCDFTELGSVVQDGAVPAPAPGA